jgi:hypothetical protein
MFLNNLFEIKGFVVVLVVFVVIIILLSNQVPLYGNYTPLSVCSAVVLNYSTSFMCIVVFKRTNHS